MFEFILSTHASSSHLPLTPSLPSKPWVLPSLGWSLLLSELQVAPLRGECCFLCHPSQRPFRHTLSALQQSWLLLSGEVTSCLCFALLTLLPSCIRSLPGAWLTSSMGAVHMTAPCPILLTALPHHVTQVSSSERKGIVRLGRDYSSRTSHTLSSWDG